MSDYFSFGSTQESVLFVNRADAGFFLNVCQSHWQGALPVKTQGPLDEADLRQQLGLMGLSEGVRDAICAIKPGFSFVFSDFGCPEGNSASAWGMSKHDGDRNNETNQIIFTRLSAPNQDLVVQVLLNNRNRGIADWKKLRKCLEGYDFGPGGSAGYDEQQLDQIKHDLESTGRSTLAPCNGSETKIAICVGNNAVPPPPNA